MTVCLACKAKVRLKRRLCTPKTYHVIFLEKSFTQNTPIGSYYYVNKEDDLLK